MKNNIKGSRVALVNVGGVPLPTPASRQNAVRGAVIGCGLGAVGAALMSLNPFGLAFLAATGAFVGATEGAKRDRE